MTPPRGLPIVLRPPGRGLVVGAGKIGLRKARSLRDAGFDVTVADRRRPGRMPRGVRFVRAEVTGRGLRRLVSRFDVVISSLPVRHLNSAVAAACRRERVLVNVVDDPELCGFTVPAVAVSGSLVVAISTSGRAPFLSAELRRELEPFVASRAPLVPLVARLRRRPGAKALLAEVFRSPEFRKAVASGAWKRARRIAESHFSRSRPAR